MNPADRHDLVQLVIRPEPGPDWTVPPDVRLRRALKALLRSFGWRCVSIGPAQATSGAAEPPDAPAAKCATGKAPSA